MLLHGCCCRSVFFFFQFFTKFSEKRRKQRERYAWRGGVGLLPSWCQRHFETFSTLQNHSHIKELLKQAVRYCNDAPLTDWCLFYFVEPLFFFALSCSTLAEKTLPQVKIHMSNLAEKRMNNEKGGRHRMERHERKNDEKFFNCYSWRNGAKYTWKFSALHLKCSVCIPKPMSKCNHYSARLSFGPFSHLYLKDTNERKGKAPREREKSFVSHPHYTYIHLQI